MIKEGKHIVYKSGVNRNDDNGKPRYGLIIPLTMKKPMLQRWAEHTTEGALKHGIRNWEKARTEEDLERFRESAFRHFLQWYNGETDEDHAAALYWNVQAAEYVKEKMN